MAGNSTFTSSDFEAVLKNDSKGNQRQIHIAKAAIDLLTTKGLEGFSFEALAKKSKTHRSLIYHYFPTYSELLLFVSAMIRYNYQKFVLDQMTEAKTAKGILTKYIQSALLWVDEAPKEASVWLLYFN